MKDSLKRERRGDGGTAFLLAQVGGLAAIKFADRIAALDLTPAQAGLLRAVAADPGRSQQAVADQLGLAPSRLVVLVDQLEHEELCERRRNPGDRRHHALHPTPTGTARLRDLSHLARAHGEDLLAPLAPDERATLDHLLARLADHHHLTLGVHPGYGATGPVRARTQPP